MTQFKVFVTRKIPGNLQPLEAIAQVEVWPQPTPPPADVLISRCRSADGLLCLLSDPIDRTLIQHSPTLKVISQMAVGYDNIDISAASQAKIPVGHTPGVLTTATADLTWALMMAAARRIVEGDRYTHSGQWQTWEPELLLGPDIGGAILGIIGMGRIGQAVAKRAQGFDMTVLYTSRNRHPHDLENRLNLHWVDQETLLRQSDFVTLHCPLTPQTQSLMNDHAFRQMRSSALLINTGRGALVDADALVRALRQHQIAGAALDVVDPEPISPDSPLLALPNVIITPHIGSASRPTREKMATMAIENLIAGLTGNRLPHCVNSWIYETD